eukprot:SAG31_NODE_8_length_42345_cov_10.980992_12_plen_96_part_00
MSKLGLELSAIARQANRAIQTEQPVLCEIVVVDDASTDDTPEQVITPLGSTAAIRAIAAKLKPSLDKVIDGKCINAVTCSQQRGFISAPSGGSIC